MRVTLLLVSTVLLLHPLLAAGGEAQGNLAVRPGLARAFERDPWLQDYAQLKARLEQSYANLAWFASPQGGVDLPALDRRTKRSLLAAENEEDAKAALLSFIAGFHDGHLARVETLLPATGPAADPPAPEWDRLTAVDGCAALGYAPVRSIPFSLPFETLNGTALESDGISRPFRAATLTSTRGRKIGIVRIARFREQDSPPSLCIQEWAAQKQSAGHINPDALKEKISTAWFRALADQLARFQKERVSAVIVDIGGNSGGNDTGDWATRLFTPREVHSARLYMCASSAAEGYFNEQLEELRRALEKHPGANPKAKAALGAAIARFEQRKAGLVARKCDMSWVWREQRPWNPAGTSRLVEAGFFSGEVGFLPPGDLGDEGLAARIYWAASVDPFRGAWSGPVYVLTDGRTASSAEMFAAVLRDHGIARIVGERTAGDGGGFMFTESPVELHHSRLRFRLPNCVRLRADGTNEVAGIKPDIPVLPLQGEGPRSRAARLLELVDLDLGPLGK